MEITKNLNRVVEVWETLLFNRIVGYKREIEINPQKPVNYLEIGKCFKNLGNWQEAENWYDEYLNRENPSADELIRYTEILAKNNHISKGEPWLKKYTNKFPEDHRLWSRYGYFLMWLGKKSEAITAFEKALKLRPYFKEALDGYDLARGKGYIYTVNDTTVRYNFGLPVTTPSEEFLIDKYYKKLAKDKNDIASRVGLIEELIRYNRYYEAEKELQTLVKSGLNEEKIKTLSNELAIKKESYLWQKASEIKSSLNEHPWDENKTIQLANIYAEQKDFESAINLLESFNQKYVFSEPVLYNLALIKSRAGDLSSAHSYIKNLLELNPANLNYQLLYGQFSVWLGRDLPTAQIYLENNLPLSEHNLDVLIALSSLHLQKNEIDKSIYYLNKASELGEEHPEIKKLSLLIDQRKQINHQQELYSLLEEARKSLFNKECAHSIELFKKYLESVKNYQEVKEEFADAYLCKGDFSQAIKIYDDLLTVNPADYDVLKKRAKLLYWSGDFLKAQKEFYNLSALYPDDAEIKLFLGDSFVAIEDYTNAKRIYSELLETAPSSFILKNRLSWIEGPENDGFYFSYMISPQAWYYSDNFDFLYSTYGLRFDLGLTDFLSLGASGFGGVLGSDSVSNNISIIKGSFTARFSKIVSALASIGNTFFPDRRSSLIADVLIKIEKPEIYTFSAGFYSADAAQLLYSPYLVDTRLRASLLFLQGDYIISDSWKFMGLYSFNTISDENIANKLQLKIGKIFDNVITTGIEYYYYDVKDSSRLYWSPSAFEAYSLWADWGIVNNTDVNALVGAKIGYIPSEKFILKEFYGNARFRISGSLYLQASLGLSTTVQSGSGYSSTSLGISVFWQL
jgi:tetratricopeptide (TPR) repeat protein